MWPSFLAIIIHDRKEAIRTEILVSRQTVEIYDPMDVLRQNQSNRQNVVLFVTVRQRGINGWVISDVVVCNAPPIDVVCLLGCSNKIIRNGGYDDGR